MSDLRNFGRGLVSNFKLAKNNTKSKRDLIFSILKSTTTKREAKNYLTKYQTSFDTPYSYIGEERKDRISSQQGQRQILIQKYLSGRNAFTSFYTEGKFPNVPLRVALIKISMFELPHDTHLGIADTLRKLVELGVSPILVYESGELNYNEFKQTSAHINSQAFKFQEMISKTAENGTPFVNSAIISDLFNVKNGALQIGSLEQILIPLYQGIVPIVLPILYDCSDGRQRHFSSSSALFNLCSILLNYTQLLSLEKVIIIDPKGGIPSVERNQTSHVFINLSQEFSDIISEMYIGHLEPSAREAHIKNLLAMNDILNLAFQKGNDTTGIISTPEVMSLNDDHMNPIIYNFLTDRPVISSSLPSSNQKTPKVSTSIIKKGFLVKLIEEHSFIGEFSFENLVKDKVVDREKLICLINDSFSKELMIDKYLKRINNTLATLIIVGDYDGAAIVTWETLANGEKIAYLDKFAIAKKNQGLPGLADVIFKLISQSHQNELLWRSKANNPVNKWYFERCRGSFHKQNSDWKLFFTGDIYDKRMGLKIDGSLELNMDITQKLRLYSQLIESIEPSFK